LARYKTFVATGIAPDGRLYAGDLNGIQDSFVSLSDFSQTLDVGILRVGDVTLQLFKYGAGEFRMTGSLRVDGILRGLGGIIGGAFTTAQRDAIPAGSRPYGLIILNTINNRYEWNSGTDAAPNWQPMQGGVPAAHAATHLLGGSDPLVFTSINLAGTRAAKPTAGINNNGLMYFETDWNALWRSNGSAWVRVAHFPRYCTISQFGALPDFTDGDEVVIEVDPATGIRWHMRYNGGSPSSYKWEYIGGAEIYGKDDTTFTVQSGSYQTGNPAVSVPRAGEYDVIFTASAGGFDNQPLVYNHGIMSFSGPGISASDSNAAVSTFISGGKLTWGITNLARVTFTGAGTVSAAYRGFNSDRVDFIRRSLRIKPVRIT
jgi:hypothetical protein